MSLSQTLFEEIRVLMQFSPDSLQEGIKVHHDAAPELVQAAQSLYDKGLIDRHDGGYLTDRGLEALQHARALTGLLSSAD
ncbi:TIGR02647 family protein [Aestuariirhabdus litorea]|uniref:TIGR02647 family protein n=1 Tax=Aestuariirhabdus litorea TaxID=2528527 RepID=A0A3P3VJF8_9GAMM|nr:TIGR02647 family protein [Aestuariirhabdus litorea]RRJ82865.1 TIGR02647 family protein [Aestuariirhabdus litorea]RWW93024.1 TIGR02647 family protein [Endozoicomonadaceae bacterium GTF-13]